MAKEKVEPEAVEDLTAKNQYTKEQIVNSDKFRANKDLLTFKLQDGKLYLLDEVQKIIDDFKKLVITEPRNEVKR